MNYNYCQQDLISMVYVIGECDGNCLLASRVYHQKYPDRRCPDVRSLENLKERFERTGSVAYEKKARRRNVLSEENELAITLAVIENPAASVRELSRDLEVSKSSVSLCLRKNKFHPYRVQLHQELLDVDLNRRLNFCHWAQNQIGENEEFFKFVLFTDESTFHRNGFVNRHNFHYYDRENPHVVQKNHYQHNWSLNVWGGIVHDYVIGPHFFEGNVNGAVFLDFMQNTFPQMIEHIPDYITNNMWLQLDGAPPHFSRNVRQAISNQFPERWIGRGGLIF